jgi:hypothetical protein
VRCGDFRILSKNVAFVRGCQGLSKDFRFERISGFV